MSLYLGDKLISGIGQDRIADTLPIGAIIEWDSDLIPENWLLLNGQAVSRTVYSELFAIYGTTYGAGNGSTTFNLPDRRTRVSVGKDLNDEDFAALGITGGEKEHTLTVDEMPTHGNHLYGSGNEVLGKGNYNDAYLKNTTMTLASSRVPRGWDLHTGDEMYPAGQKLGGSQSHNNLQPYIVTNFIVKAKLYTTEFIGGNMVIDNLTSDSSVNVLSARMGKELDVKKFDKGEVLDYIIETGTDGIWTYRKWNSGIAECWGNEQVSVAITGTWGSLYYGEAPAANFPTGLFTTLISLHKDVRCVSGWSCWLGSYSSQQYSTENTGVTALFRPTSASQTTYHLCYQAIGRWK